MVSTTATPSSIPIPIPAKAAAAVALVNAAAAAAAAKPVPTTTKPNTANSSLPKPPPPRRPPSRTAPTTPAVNRKPRPTPREIDRTDSVDLGKRGDSPPAAAAWPPPAQKLKLQLPAPKPLPTSPSKPNPANTAQSPPLPTRIPKKNPVSVSIVTAIPPTQTPTRISIDDLRVAGPATLPPTPATAPKFKRVRHALPAPTPQTAGRYDTFMASTPKSSTPSTLRKLRTPTTVASVWGREVTPSSSRGKEVLRTLLIGSCVASSDNPSPAPAAPQQRPTPTGSLSKLASTSTSSLRSPTASNPNLRTPASQDLSPTVLASSPTASTQNLAPQPDPLAMEALALAKVRSGKVRYGMPAAPTVIWPNAGARARPAPAGPEPEDKDKDDAEEEEEADEVPAAIPPPHEFPSAHPKLPGIPVAPGTKWQVPQEAGEPRSSVGTRPPPSPQPSAPAHNGALAAGFGAPTRQNSFAVAPTPTLMPPASHQPPASPNTATTPHPTHKVRASPQPPPTSPTPTHLNPPTTTATAAPSPTHTRHPSITARASTTEPNARPPWNPNTKLVPPELTANPTPHKSEAVRVEPPVPLHLLPAAEYAARVSVTAARVSVSAIAGAGDASWAGGFGAPTGHHRVAGDLHGGGGRSVSFNPTPIAGTAAPPPPRARASTVDTPSRLAPTSPRYRPTPPPITRTGLIMAARAVHSEPGTPSTRRRRPTGRANAAPVATPTEPPPPPPETFYETRPMSPHKAYNLSDHLRAAAMRMQPPDIRDNFNARMRALFLPSLFQSSEDLAETRAAAERRKRRAMGAGTAGESSDDLWGRQGDGDGGDFGDDDGGTVVRFEIGAARNAAKKAMRATGAERDDNPMLIPRQGVHTPVGGSSNPGDDAVARSSNRARARAIAGTNSTTAVAVRGGRGGTRGHAFLRSPKPGSKPLVKYPIATIDKQAFDLNPPDLPRGQLLWRWALYRACRDHRIRCEVLEDMVLAGASEAERTADVVHVPDPRARSSVVGHVTLGGGGAVKIAPGVVEVGGLAAGVSDEEMTQDRMNVIACMRIKRLFDIPIQVREEADFDEMDAILGKFKIFSRLPPMHRFKLYNACKLESYPRGKLLIREGNQARTMYVILLGECLLQIRPGHPTAAVNLRLGVGDTAGEFSSYALNEVRNMRATCLLRTEVLVIDKLDFVTISREARTVDSYVAEYFATVPSLLSADKQLPVFLSQRSIVRRYDPESLLIRAGETCANNYFIIRGKCRALHMVTFVKQDLGPEKDALSAVMGSHARHKYSLVPYSSTAAATDPPPHFGAGHGTKPTAPGGAGANGGPKLNPNDELVRELATVAELGPGQMFPPLMGCKVTFENPHLKAALLKNHEVDPDLPDDGPDVRRQLFRDRPPPSPFHFVVVEKLECVVISHQDLLETLPKDIFSKLCDASMAVTEVSSQEIEERYLASQGWRGSRELGTHAIKDLVDPDSFKDASWSNPVCKKKVKEEIAAGITTEVP
ncbi:hypothetical protein HDU96_000997 [Phlyctochytrium bullatum]|nr:hypothetical protein HDU96_000997 [Phlyctochytrium bullatum]